MVQHTILLWRLLVLTISFLALNLNIKAQIVLHSYIGLGRSFTSVDYKSDNASNVNRLNEFYFGFEFERIQTKKISYSFQYSSGSAMMNVSQNTLRPFPLREIICLSSPRSNFRNYKNASIIEADAIPLKSYIFKFNYMPQKKLVYNRKQYKKDDAILELHKSISLQLSFGAGINRISKYFELTNQFLNSSTPSPPTDTTTSTDDTVTPWEGFGNTSKFEYFNYKDKATLNRTVPCIQFGLKTQFINFHEKKRLELGFLVNLGLIRMVESPFHFNSTFYNHQTEQLEIQEMKGKFFSRGTYITYFISYPITILNQKGERRSDRKNQN